MKAKNFGLAMGAVETFTSLPGVGAGAGRQSSVSKRVIANLEARDNISLYKTRTNLYSPKYGNSRNTGITGL